MAMVAVQMLMHVTMMMVLLLMMEHVLIRSVMVHVIVVL